MFVTDDLGGESTVDDDQTIQFLKVRSDLAFVSEVLSRIVAYNREFADAATVSESHAITFTRPVSDAFTASESLDRTASYNREFADSGLLSDDQAITTGKALADSYQVSDVASTVVQYNRDIEDSSQASESVAISFAIGSIADLLQVAESLAKVLQKGESDTLAGSDSGTLLNQDYVDNPFYFADDYVGDKRIF